MRRMLTVQVFAGLFLFHALAALAGIFLHGVLFLLAVTTAHTLGGRSLGPKSCPRTKVLASLAPLDFESIDFEGDPHGDIASRANTLVLTRNDVGGTTRSVRHGTFLATRSRLATGLLVGADKGGRDAELSTHDTTLLAA